MKELEIALAIALSFLVFSTFASMILELLYRLLNTRFKGLKVMLSEICEKELSSFAGSNNNNSNQGNTNQTNSIQKNPPYQVFKNLLNNVKNVSQELIPMLMSKIHKGNDTQFCPNMVSHFVKDTQNNHTMTTTQFIERLATTDIGREIARYSQDELTTLVNHFGRRYDIFCEEATLSFKKNSETLTMVISVLMAFALNINLITLGNTFIENRALTNELVAQTNVIIERAEQQQKNLQNLMENKNLPKDISTKDLETSLNSLHESYQSMEKMQLPIGWSRSSIQFFEATAAKWVCNYKSDDEHSGNPVIYPYDKCKDNQQKIFFWITAIIVVIIIWAPATLITGLLIGLGGPFWFDVAKRISAFRSVLSSATTDKNQTQEQATGNDKAPPKDLVKVFEETVKAGELIANTHQPYLSPAPSSVRLG